MAVTTTESIASPLWACSCGKVARGGALLNGKALCCVSVHDQALLEAMIGDAPEVAEPISFVAHDPLSTKKGVTAAAGRVLMALYEKKADPSFRERSRQATQ